MVLKLRLSMVIAAVALVLFALAPTAGAKSTGGCPSGDNWQLVTVASLGFTDTSGIASLDGNGDGLTCIKVLSNGPGGGVFRDNTVQGP